MTPLPKRKMQDVSFSDISEFLDYLPDDERRIVEVLRNLVLDCIPACREKLSYNVPYYSRKANICFIWPGSIGWGGVTNQGVRFGFTRGHLLRDEIAFLDKGNRKQVYWRDYFNVSEIDPDLLKAYIFEAVEIDTQMSSRSSPAKMKSRIRQK
jgi:hypothetical protein